MRLMLTFAAAAAATFSNAGAAEFATDAGPVAGTEKDGVILFKAVPYAAPPVGALRWRAPLPPKPWTTVRAGEQFSPKCMQIGMYPEDSPPEPMSEDCLYLNVWAPAESPVEPLPVMVWIHGGGLVNGSGSAPLYAGDALARRGVIAVTLNYRVGALGFLAHPELSLESDAGVSGNYGLLDQIAALRWIQKNIAAFGGDPQNVTVFGQSSGAISISALTASPLARGLFHRAIGQSGGLFEPLDAAPEFKLAGAEEVGQAFAQKLGARSIATLRELPAEQIIAARFSPQPNIDGYVLTETPYEAFAMGRQHSVDVLVGSNEAEGLYFLAGREIGADNLIAELSRDFPSFIVSLIGPKAPADDAAARAAFIAFESDMRFGWNMWAWAKLHAASGKGRVYHYRFSHSPPGQEGASHGAEMPYIFDHPELGPGAWSEGDRLLAERMASYWTNFAKRGDPNGEGLPAWPAYDASARKTQLIGERIATGAVPNEARLAAIDRLYAAIRFLLNYGVFVVGGFALLLAGALWRIGAMLFRGRRARA